MKELIIKNLHVNIEGTEILKGVNLEIRDDEVHALMGPNGNGKSTLLSAVMGHPKYEVTKGSITLNGEDVLAMGIEERSQAGLFLGMQYPQEVPGVLNSDFLKAAINAHRDQPIDLFEFIKSMDHVTQELELSEDLAHRFLNEGFSGGEKKRNEIVQMRLLNPDFAMLDEIDSGLDVDALSVVADSILKAKEETGVGLLIISHYGRFYDLIKPTHVHVMMNGKIVTSGGQELAHRIDQEGYEKLAKELGVEMKKPAEKQVISVESCAVAPNQAVK